MSRVKGLSVSPLTNTIYYGTQHTSKHMCVGVRKDVTSEAIGAVFEWFIGNMNKLDDNSEYTVTYPDTDYELVMRRRK